MHEKIIFIDYVYSYMDEKILFIDDIYLYMVEQILFIDYGLFIDVCASFIDRKSVV